MENCYIRQVQSCWVHNVYDSSDLVLFILEQSLEDNSTKTDDVVSVVLVGLEETRTIENHSAVEVITLWKCKKNAKVEVESVMSQTAAKLSLTPWKATRKAPAFCSQIFGR